MLLFSVCTAGLNFQVIRIFCFDLIEVPEATPNPSSWFLAHFLIGLPQSLGDDFPGLVGKTRKGEWRIVFIFWWMCCGFSLDKGEE